MEDEYNTEEIDFIDVMTDSCVHDCKPNCAMPKELSGSSPSRVVDRTGNDDFKRGLEDALAAAEVLATGRHVTGTEQVDQENVQRTPEQDGRRQRPATLEQALEWRIDGLKKLGLDSVEGEDKSEDTGSPSPGLPLSEAPNLLDNSTLSTSIDSYDYGPVDAFWMFARACGDVFVRVHSTLERVQQQGEVSQDCCEPPKISFPTARIIRWFSMRPFHVLLLPIDPSRPHLPLVSVSHVAALSEFTIAWGILPYLPPGLSTPLTSRVAGGLQAVRSAVESLSFPTPSSSTVRSGQGPSSVQASLSALSSDPAARRAAATRLNRALDPKDPYGIHGTSVALSQRQRGARLLLTAGFLARPVIQDAKRFSSNTHTQGVDKDVTGKIQSAPVLQRTLPADAIELGRIAADLLPDIWAALAWVAFGSWTGQDQSEHGNDQESVMQVAKMRKDAAFSLSPYGLQSCLEFAARETAPSASETAPDTSSMDRALRLLLGLPAALGRAASSRVPLVVPLPTLTPLSFRPLLSSYLVRALFEADFASVSQSMSNPAAARSRAVLGWCAAGCVRAGWTEVAVEVRRSLNAALNFLVDWDLRAVYVANETGAPPPGTVLTTSQQLAQALHVLSALSLPLLFPSPLAPRDDPLLALLAPYSSSVYRVLEAGTRTRSYMKGEAEELLRVWIRATAGLSVGSEREAADVEAAVGLVEGVMWGVIARREGGGGRVNLTAASDGGLEVIAVERSYSIAPENEALSAPLNLRTTDDMKVSRNSSDAPRILFRECVESENNADSILIREAVQGSGSEPGSKGVSAPVSDFSVRLDPDLFDQMLSDFASWVERMDTVDFESNDTSSPPRTRSRSGRSTEHQDEAEVATMGLKQTLFVRVLSDWVTESVADDASEGSDEVNPAANNQSGSTPVGTRLLNLSLVLATLMQRFESTLFLPVRSTSGLSSYPPALDLVRALLIRTEATSAASVDVLRIAMQVADGALVSWTQALAASVMEGSRLVWKMEDGVKLEGLAVVLGAFARHEDKEVGRFSKRAAEMARSVGEIGKVMAAVQDGGADSVREIDSSGDNSAVEARYAMAMADARSPVAPFRAKGLSALRNLILDDERAVSTFLAQRLSDVIEVILDALGDPDSFAYLTAVRTLSACAEAYPREALTTMAREFGNPTGDKDRRLRIGESMLQSMQRAGETVAKVADVLAPAMLAVLNAQPGDEDLASSALSLMGAVVEGGLVWAGPRLAEVVTDAACGVIEVENGKSVKLTRGGVWVLLCTVRGVRRMLERRSTVKAGDFLERTTVTRMKRCLENVRDCFVLATLSYRRDTPLVDNLPDPDQDWDVAKSHARIALSELAEIVLQNSRKF
ncbi:transmembrane and coiled-coil domains-containing protein 7 [Gonapodya sp. JEL0774]|nr:transmembrane and coiled-coil domains-containing protein 7 [Gonapodya sp. JEL0774]